MVRDARGQYDEAAAAEAVPPGAAEEAAARAPGVSATKRLRVLCVPAEDVADQLAGRMAAHLLAARGHDAVTTNTPVTARDLAAAVSREAADVVVVSAVAPGGGPGPRGVPPAASRLPQVKVVVGLWNAAADPARARERFAGAGADLVTTSLTEAVGFVQQSAEPVAPAPRR